MILCTPLRPPVGAQPQRAEDAIPGPAPAPAAQAPVRRLPRAVTFRQVTPGDPGPDLVDHPVDDLPVRHPRPARRSPRYQRSE